MKIELCFGSSCHVKGANTVFELLKAALKENHLEDKVEVAGTLCLGQCKEPGANLRLDGEIVTGITASNFKQFFDTRIKQALMGK
ncbi:MAG: (2Fe-2S) ferredoxin domain-containing protein [Sphaerochaetaceae bacterium]